MHIMADADIGFCHIMADTDIGINHIMADSGFKLWRILSSGCRLKNIYSSILTRINRSGASIDFEAGGSKVARIAVYGKGGIGKSTVSANLSAALARSGYRVMQIGCDPKHDSTRLLLGGLQIRTVMDYIRETLPDNYRLSDVLFEGYMGIGCVEAGGPKPGVGCAGRGIISTFELLAQLNAGEGYDTVVYDVLGDVVCGGFAVPIRREYADTILVVTSGEFMSLYAANNILRGIANYDGDQRRVAGIVLNERTVDGEIDRVERFAKAVGLPIVTRIPRSDSFARAERVGKTVVEIGDDAKLGSIFADLAARVVEECELFGASPLSDEELERVVLGSESADTAKASGACNTSNRGDVKSTHDRSPSPPAADSGVHSPEEEDTPSALYLSKNLKRGEPLHGCAFSGALSVAVHLRDAAVLAHSPKSCTFISFQAVSSSGRRRLFERGSLLPASLAPNLQCTEMGQPEIVFGGMERLREKIASVAKDAPSAIVVISSCPSGIIGDDVDSVVDMSHPGMPVIPICTDGNMSGDFLQGIFMGYMSIARSLVDPEVSVDPQSVNIIAEKPVVMNTEDNFTLILGFLSRMGISINCRYLYNSTVADVRRLCSAALTLPAYSDYTSTTLGKFLTDEFGMEVADRGFPIGFDETCDWLRWIGARFGSEETAEEIIGEWEERYRKDVEELRSDLEGHKLMIITFNYELDWILKTAIDIGMVISKICVLDYSQDEGFRSRLGVALPVEEGYDPAKRDDDLAEQRPSVVLSNYAFSTDVDVPVLDTIPMCPDAGFESGLVLARRWAVLLRSGLRGGWEDDAELSGEHLAR